MTQAGGLNKAKAKCGGGRALARRIKVSPSAVAKWLQVPEARVFQVETATGVPAEELRPDLVASIRIERQKRLLAKARERFAFGNGTIKTRADPNPQAIEIFDLGLIVAAQQFAAKTHGLKLPELLGAFDWSEKSARAYGLALAYVVARVSSTLIAATLGTTRQNVENVGNRYLRARDGDDEDEREDGFVMERGRRRRAKGGDDDLWALERRFLDWIEGNL